MGLFFLSFFLSSVLKLFGSMHLSPNVRLVKIKEVNETNDTHQVDDVNDLLAPII